MKKKGLRPPKVAGHHAAGDPDLFRPTMPLAVYQRILEERTLFQRMPSADLFYPSSPPPSDVPSPDACFTLDDLITTSAAVAPQCDEGIAAFAQVPLASFALESIDPDTRLPNDRATRMFFFSRRPGLA